MNTREFNDTQRFSLNLHRIGIHHLSKAHRLILGLYLSHKNPLAIVPKGYQPKIATITWTGETRKSSQHPRNRS